MSGPVESCEIVAVPDSALGVQGQRSTPALLEVGGGIIRIAEAGSVFVVGAALAFLLQEQLQIVGMANYSRAALLAAFIFAVSSELTGSYDADCRFSLRVGWGKIFTAWLATGIGVLAFAFFMKVSTDFSRGWVGLWFGLETVALGSIRAAGTAWMRSLKRKGRFNQRVAIYGAGAQGNRLAQYIIADTNLIIEIVGFYDERPARRLPQASAPVALEGTLQDLIDRIKAGEIDQVIIALPLSAEDRVQAIVGQLALFPVLIRLAPDLASFAFARRPVVMLGGLPVMTLFERPISGLDQYLKKAEDLILGLLMTLAASPILLATAIAIKIDSPGPVFFRQEREGYNHKRFRIWKFRSMYTNASQFHSIEQATKGDPRVTRVGRFIRATSIDELPQLFNVLGGEMSLVGPRPHAPSTRVGVLLFSEAVATYAARHKVKPGLTGWAQVNGWRGETDTEDKLLKRLDHDLFYIEHWSVGFDIYIMARTVATVLFHRTAY